MESGLSYLVDQLLLHDSVPAVYQSEAGLTEIRAIPRFVRRDQKSNYELTVDADSMDWIVPTSDYPLDPVIGDRIIARNKIYEVRTMTETTFTGAVAWRWCEGCYEKARRIHTKFIGDVE